MSVEDVLEIVDKFEVKCVDLRFTDTRGKEQHVSIPTSGINRELFESGKMFDGSSICGWQPIHQSDLSLLPDLNTALMDPFCEENTLFIRCDIIDPETNDSYERDPRSVAKRAEEYLKSTGIADTANFGPEPEFFLFDDIGSIFERNFWG